MNVLLVGIALFLLSLPVLRRPRQEDDPKARGRLVLALLLKLLGGLALYWVTFKFYKGGDANFYHGPAVMLAQHYRAGHFAVRLPGGLGLVGDGFVEVIAGLVYAIVGTSKMAGFLVFAWLGFWGLYFFYRAFQIAVSQETSRRYSRLVFFLPSLLFWSSSIGKDAWMVLTLGLACYGIARLLTHRRGGYLIAATGLLGTAMVRPHVTLMIMVGVVVAYAFRRSGPATGHSRVAKIIGLGVLAGGSFLVVGRVEQFLHIKKIEQKSINDVLSTEATNSNYGGSAYTARNPSLVGLPQASVTVLFRPFPWEAHSSQQIAASIEGLFLIGVTIRSWPRLRQVPASLRRTPYVALAAVYSLLFMYFFSSFANFGLLARERDQLYPLFFVLLALPVASRPPRYSKRARLPSGFSAASRPSPGVTVTSTESLQPSALARRPTARRVTRRVPPRRLGRPASGEARP